MDMYATFAKWAGAELPTDRIIDSVDQSDFLMGKKDKSNRDGFVVYVGNDLFGAKWRNWKMMFTRFLQLRPQDGRRASSTALSH